MTEVAGIELEDWLPEDDDDYEYWTPGPPYECECGEIEYDCEMCGYHTHYCVLEDTVE